ncbi:MAG: hypothetical protein KAS32_07390 [Candidatus Peribacteraceae bacterium]|nr:hypothetical protein [Candidatus Peribacteraceae bacterium]
MNQYNKQLELRNLVGFGDETVNMMLELAHKFSDIGAPHYDQMIRGYIDSIDGAIIVLKSVHGKKSMTTKEQ